jgi:hypothetical protein
MGKEPVEANDSPGFISNRILCPMINEAVFALQEGVGTPEAIDQVMKLGMNHPMGPLDAGGLDRLGCGAVRDGSVAARSRRRQIPPRLFAAQDGGCGLFGKKDGTRVLYVLCPSDSLSPGGEGTRVTIAGMIV